jgi:hypothetical protein
MQVPKGLELERACSKGPSRYGALDSISVEQEGTGHVAVATDGKVLAVVPVNLEEGDEPGLIPARAWADARRASRDGGRLSPNGLVRWAVKGGAVASAERPSGDFPKWRAVLPPADAKAPVLAFNAEYLADLARALGSDSGSVRLELPVDEEGRLRTLAPFRVVAGCGFGAIMPVTLDSDGGKGPVVRAGAAEPLGAPSGPSADALLVAELRGDLAELRGAMDECERKLTAAAGARDLALDTARELRIRLETAERERDAAVFARSAAVAELEGSAPLPELPPDAQELEGPTVRAGKAPGYVEVLFPEKPGYLVRADLKAAGFRWSKADGLWWGREDRLPSRLGVRASVEPVTVAEVELEDARAQHEPAPKARPRVKAPSREHGAAPSRKRASAPAPGGSIAF